MEPTTNLINPLVFSHTRIRDVNMHVSDVPLLSCSNQFNGMTGTSAQN